MGINRTKSHTPPSTTLALQAWSRVAHLSFHATLWFCFVLFCFRFELCCPNCRPTSFPSKGGKKKSKKRRKVRVLLRKRAKKGLYSSRPSVGRFVDSWLGKTESRPVASWPSVQSPPALAKWLIPVIFFPVVVLPQLHQCTDAQASCSLTRWST